jgi:hypothetical protein
VNFATSASQAVDKIAFATEALKMHACRSRDLTYALAAEWRLGKGKTEAASQAFLPDLHQAQILTCDVRSLKPLAAALRRTTGEMGAS